MDLLTSQKEKVDKLNLELAFHKSAESTFKHYVEDIEQEPCCPLCHKNLDANDSEIKVKIRQLPSRISETVKELKLENDKYHEMNKCKSSYDSLEKLELEVKKFEANSRKSICVKLI
ncbi:MAG: hypothetical protein ACRDAX_00965 [Propionibacteriaceae bacterium]